MEQSAIGEPTYRGTPRINKPFVEYSEAIAAEICQGLALGQSIRTICNNPDMPEPRSVYRWLIDHPDFAKQYAQAREDAADAFAEEIVEIADAECPVDALGRIDSGSVQKQRLRVDARKWIASKLKPRSYGDKVDIALSGNVSVTRTFFNPNDVIDAQIVPASTGLAKLSTG